MNKKTIRNLLIGTGVLVLVVWFLFVPTTDEDSVISQISSPKDDFSNVGELHFSKMPITYSYEEDFCIGPIVPRIEWAFDILENETDGLLMFENVNSSDSDINFVCYPQGNTRA